MPHANIVNLPAPVRTDLTGRERTELTASLLREAGLVSGALRERIMMQVAELNLPLAYSLARHYAGRGLSVDDLQQVAAMGLVSAARRYDPERGSDFFAFAIPTVRGELRKHFRDAGWTVRPPRRIQELQARLWAAEAELTQELGRTPTPAEVAERLDVGVDDVVEALGVTGCFAPNSLDAPVGQDGATFGDLRGGDDDDFESCEARVVLGPLVRELGERDRRIIELRFFHGWSQQRIGEEIGVTQMQVSRLLNRILRDLRRMMDEPAAISRTA